MRALVFLDDRLPAWRRFLQAPTAGEILRDRQVHLRVLSDDGVWGPQLARIATYFSQLPAAIALDEGYERGRALHEQLIELHFSRSLVASQQLNLNATVYRNFYANVASMEGVVHGLEMKGQFAKVPALICGAGPSLARALPLLRELRDRMVIVGAGSALTALTGAGVVPHLGAGLCPEASEAHRFWHQHGFELPFLYRSRIDRNALFSIHGPHIYLNGCSGAWRMAEWLEEGLGMGGEAVDEGPSVTYLSAQFLHLLGCDPIIFVGLDLALEEERSYVTGVLHGSENPLVDWEVVKRRDIHGKPVDTYWKWIWESHVLGGLVSHLSETTFINASGGGIGIPGTEVMALDEVGDRYAIHPRDLSGQFHAALEGRDHPRITADQIGRVLGEMEESLQRLVGKIKALLSELKAIEGRVVAAAIGGVGRALAGEGEAFTLSTPRPWVRRGQVALLVREIEEEIAYDKILEPMWQAQQTYLARVYDQFGDRYGPTAIRWRRELSIQQAKWATLLAAAEQQRGMIGVVIAQNVMEGRG